MIMCRLLLLLLLVPFFTSAQQDTNYLHYRKLLREDAVRLAMNIVNDTLALGKKPLPKGITRYFIPKQLVDSLQDLLAYVPPVMAQNRKIMYETEKSMLTVSYKDGIYGFFYNHFKGPTDKKTDDKIPFTGIAELDSLLAKLPVHLIENPEIPNSDPMREYYFTCDSILNINLLAAEIWRIREHERKKHSTSVSPPDFSFYLTTNFPSETKYFARPGSDTLGPYMDLYILSREDTGDRRICRPQNIPFPGGFIFRIYSNGSCRYEKQFFKNPFPEYNAFAMDGSSMY
jgi:hypothetical protein